MAEVTPGSYLDYGDPYRIMPVSTGVATGPAGGTPAYIEREGLHHHCLRVSFADTDTLVPAGAGVVNCAFARSSADDYGDLRSSAAGTGTFRTTATLPTAGFVHVWSKNTGISLTASPGSVSQDAYVDSLDPLRQIPFHAEGDVLATATGAPFKDGTRLGVFRFDDVADGSTWTSNIPGILSLATSRIGSLSTPYCSALLTTFSTGKITFTISSSTPDFFLYVWSQG